MKLTANDRRFLLRNFISCAEPEPVEERTAMEKLLKRNMQLLDEREELLQIQTALIEQRDYWQRCCRRAVACSAAMLAVLCALVWRFI